MTTLEHFSRSPMSFEMERGETRRRQEGDPIRLAPNRPTWLPVLKLPLTTSHQQWRCKTCVIGNTNTSDGEIWGFYGCKVEDWRSGYQSRESG